MRKKLAIFLPLMILAIILAGYPLMVLSLEKQGRALFRRIVHPGDTFQLGYLHSVAKSDVWDTFQINSQGEMLLIETRFQGQGYGLPGGPSGSEQWTREGDWFRISRIHRVLPFIDWRIQREWKDRFRFLNEPAIDVSARVGNGLIQIRVEKVRLIHWLGFLLQSWISNGRPLERLKDHGE